MRERIFLLHSDHQPQGLRTRHGYGAVLIGQNRKIGSGPAVWGRGGAKKRTGEQATWLAQCA